MKNLKFYLLSLILLFDFYISTFISSKFLNLFIALGLVLFFTKGIKKELPNIIMFLGILTTASLTNPSLDTNNFFSEYIKLLSVVIFYFALENDLAFITKFLRIFFKISVWTSVFLIFLKLVSGASDTTTIFELDTSYLRFNISAPVLLLPILIGKLKELRFNKKFFVFGLVAITIVTLLSNWRAIQVGLIFIILYYYFFNFKYIKAKILITIFLAGSLFYLNIEEIKIVKSLSTPAASKDISSGRFYLWAKSLNTFQLSENKYKIFGYGFGQYPQAINLFGFNSVTFKLLNNEFESFNEKGKDSRIHAHNPFFNILIENGIIGLLMYIILYASIIRQIKTYQKQEFKGYYLTLFIVLLSGMFTSISYLNAPMLWLLLYLSKNRIYYDNRSLRTARSR